MNYYRLADTSDENLPFDVFTPADPTGNPSFAAVAPGEIPATYDAGSWSGAYTDGSRQALTPLLPATLGLTAGKYDLYLTWTVGSETVVRQVATLEVVT